MATLRLGNPNNSLLDTDEGSSDPFFLSNQEAYRRDVLNPQPKFEQPRVALAQPTAPAAPTPQPATPEPQRAQGGATMFGIPVADLMGKQPAKSDQAGSSGGATLFGIPAADLAGLSTQEPEPEPKGKKPGLISDVGNLAGIGVNTAAQDVRELVGKIPGVGKSIVKTLDSIDEWASGKSSEELLKGNIKQAQERLSPETQAAGEKKWWDSDKNSFGNAWADPRSYISGLVTSLPEQALTMIPAMRLAKGVYASKIAAGVAPEAAAVASSRAATVAGGVGEGLLGGAQSSRKVREDILAMPEDRFKDSEAMQALMAQGMSFEQARAQLANDSASQAFILAGVTTGVFGGMGDRIMAKAITQGIGKSVAGRAFKGAVGEGLLEEFPQSYTQAVSENVAKRRADPSIGYTDDALNQALGGLAVGAVQGGGLAAAFGRNESVPQSNPTVDRVLEQAKQEPEPTNSAGFVPEPNSQLQAQLDAVVEGRKPAVVMGLDEAANVNSRDLTSFDVVDPETGNASVVFTKQEVDPAQVQARVNEVGLKQAMGEVLGLVEPDATTNPTGNEVVVQQRDNQSGEIITEQAVSPENVAKVTPVPGTTANVTTAEQAKADRTSEIDAAAQQAATSKLNDLPEPSDAQKAAGNYKKGSVKMLGLDISVENPVGSERSGTDASGKAWKTEMQHHYGYVKGSKGNDKDQVDVFIGPNPESGKVFVVDQIDPATGKFDEHKAMLGFNSIEEAAAGYRANYSADWQGMGAISEMPADAFKSWVKDGQKKKPLAYQEPQQTQQKEQPNATQVGQEQQGGQPEREGTGGRLEEGRDNRQEQTGQQESSGEAGGGNRSEQGGQKQTVEQKVKAKARSKKVKQEAKSEPEAPANKVSQAEVIEFWEDQDDGVNHIPWAQLSKERQRDWIEAMEDGYASADLHDNLVRAEQQNARAERANAKARENIDREQSGDSVFRTSESKGEPLTVDLLTKMVEKFKANWVNMPEVKIVQSESELPAKILGDIVRAGMQGKTMGLYRNGKVWLIGDAIRSERDAILTIVHETAGHYGLRATLGEDHAAIMRDLYNTNNWVRQQADQMMVKEGLPIEVAVEEVLADVAEQKLQIPEAKSALAKLYAALRKWLRDTFNVAYASNEELRQIVANARRYVEFGDVEAGKGGAAAADASIKTALARAKAPTFYSVLERSLRMDKRESAQPKDWKAIIENLPGVKDEERDWTGVLDWLDAKAAEGVKKIDRQDVVNFVAGNRLLLNDVILEGVGKYMTDEDLRELYAAHLGVGIEDVDFDMSRADMLYEMGMTERMASGTKHGSESKGLVLPGGKKQFELVLVEPSTRTQPYREDDRIHFGDVSGGKALGWLRGNIRKDAQGNDVLFLEEIQSQRGQDMREEENEVPAGAPFVSDTNAWTALLLKRAVAYAQEKGIDRIAWTTGEQQAERYRMSKRFDKMTVKRNEDGTFNVVGEKNGDTPVNKSSVPENKLASVVGKDLAARAIADNGFEFVGTEMDIGNEGLSNYYNKTVGRVADKALKAYGVKTEVMNIEGTGQQLGFVITPKLQAQVETDGMPMFRRKDYESQYNDLDPATREMALRKGHYTPPTIGERLKALKPRWQQRLVQGVFDRYRAIKDLDPGLYIKARLANGKQDGAVATMLEYGQVFDDGGALNIKQGTKSLKDILKPLGGEVDRYLLWVAANRADKLKAEDRENFFSDAEIKALKNIHLKNMPDGRSRAAVYLKVLKDMNDMNRSVLDLAKEKGLLSEDAYKRFSQDIWYVPFYRAMDDKDADLGTINTSTKKLTNQQFSDKLKGSERPLNDLLENVLLNWSHILSASMKNGAANEIMDQAMTMGAVEKLAGAEKGAVKTMVNGKEQYWKVKDDLLLDSLTLLSTMPSYGYFTKLAAKFKSVLTQAVSLSPTFRINNLIGDSIQSLATSELKGPLQTIEGWRLYKDKRAEALAGGGLFAHGMANDGEVANNIRRLQRQIGNVEVSNLTGLKDAMLKVVDKYEKFGDRFENANRLGLYAQMREKGMSHAEATFAAKDLQDFGLQGSFAAIRWLATVVPYFNARLQGMYKLGRGYQDQPARFRMVAATVIAASLVLYLSQKDDDDWKKREDWERDMYWWFKVPGTDTAIRIRKPFELGAVSSIVERAVEQIVDDSVEGKVFGKRLLAILGDNLSLLQMPQIAKPLYELGINKNSFTGRPIDPKRDMPNAPSPENRVSPGNSSLGVGLSKANAMFAEFVQTVTGQAVDADKLKLSPSQYDHLIRGYLGWVGTVVLATTDAAVQQFKEGEAPAKKIDDLFVVGNFVRSLPASQSRFVSSFYENARDIAMVQADYNAFKKAGDAEAIQELLTEKKDKLAMAKLYARTTEKLAKLNENIRFVKEDKTMSAEEKRMHIDRYEQLRIDVARQVEELRVKKSKEK